MSLELNHHFADREICTICMDEFEAKDSCYLLACNHIFHEACVNRWLSIAHSCPICRREVKYHRSFFVRLKDYTIQAIVYAVPSAVFLDGYLHNIFVFLSVNRIQEIKKHCGFTNLPGFLEFLEKYIKGQVEDPSLYCDQAKEFAALFADFQKSSPLIIFSLVVTGFVAYKFFNSQEGKKEGYRKVEWPLTAS